LERATIKVAIFLLPIVSNRGSPAVRFEVTTKTLQGKV
jgi:hypothetical protein